MAVFRFPIHINGLDLSNCIPHFFILANSADPDEMWRTWHLHCLLTEYSIKI